MYIDRRILYIILGLIILSNVIGLLTNTDDLLSLLMSLPAVLIAITFHEFAHAFVADKLGDDTPRKQGRLSLNPFAHLDPIGSIMLIFAGFGWGKPVEINSRNFNRNIKMPVAEAMVATAGPIMNFILAIIFAVIYAIIWKFAPIFMVNQIGFIIMLIIQSCIVINLGLGIFNLIPLPPLDGSKIVMGFLPYNAKNWVQQYGQYFYIAFVVIWVTGIAGRIISPLISGAYTGLMKLVFSMFGIL